MTTHAPFVREAENPLVTPEMVTPWQQGFQVVCAFNAGVARFGEETLLLLRVAEKPPQVSEDTVSVPLLTRKDGRWQVEVRTLSRSDSR